MAPWSFRVFSGKARRVTGCGSGALGRLLVAGGHVCAIEGADSAIAKAKENAANARRNGFLILTASLMLKAGVMALMNKASSPLICPFLPNRSRCNRGSSGHIAG